MAIEVYIVAATFLTGLVGLWKAISKWLQRGKSREVSISFEDGKYVLTNVNKDDVKKIIEKLSQAEDQPEPSKKKLKDESGFVSREFLIYFVPGIIALSLTGLYIYLYVTNQQTEGYSVPEGLSTLIKMILGYFFGVGASAAVNQRKNLTEEDIKKILG